MTWNEIQAKAAEAKWGIAGLCFMKSECIHWEDRGDSAHVVIRAPIKTFTTPLIVEKVRDRLTILLNKPVQLLIISPA